MEKHEKRRIPDIRQDRWDPRAQQEGRCARIKHILVKGGEKRALRMEESPGARLCEAMVRVSGFATVGRKAILRSNDMI